MSHTTKVKVKIKDPKAIKEAAQKLGLSCTIHANVTDVKLFAGHVKANAEVKLKGWQFPLAINTKTGEMNFDNYNGGWGDIKELDKFHQQYQLAVAEQESQELIMKGYQASIETLPNGDIQYVLDDGKG